MNYKDQLQSGRTTFHILYKKVYGFLDDASLSENMISVQSLAYLLKYVEHLEQTVLNIKSED